MTLEKSIDIELNQNARGFHINQTMKEAEKELQELSEEFYIEKPSFKKLRELYCPNTSCLYKKPTGKNISEETKNALNLRTKQYWETPKNYSIDEKGLVYFL